MISHNRSTFENMQQQGYSQAGSRHEIPTCAICTDALGTCGGPASLPCGHNGCLDCLQKVQMHSSFPLCPLCRTPFDSNQTLCLNLDLKEALDRACSLESECPIGENIGRKCFIYDRPLPEETGSWIPVSVPPTTHSGQFDISNYEGDFFPEGCSWVASSTYKNTIAPDLTAWSIMIEVIAFLCGARKPKGKVQKGRYLTYEDHWDDYLDSSFTAQMEDDIRNMSAVLAAEPPQWLPDSSSVACMQCHARFYPITCTRHHCRFCGRIFCGYCTAQRTLLPVKFRQKSPQRVCDSCFERLAPVQGILLEQVSNAAQVAIHDVTDLSCLRSWINNPLGFTLEQEIYKATNTLHKFSEVGRLKPEQGIPGAILKGAKGLAIFTVVKAGVMVTYKVGSGLVVAKKSDGSWSAPSAIFTCGTGWGPQAGGEITDFIVVLRNEAAVKAFASRAHLSFGAGLSVAAGPVGRIAEADLRAGNGGAAACYTYSLSKGMFAGLSLEGDIVMARNNANIQFYGDPSINSGEILLGSAKQPKAAAPLYSALSGAFRKVRP